MSGTAEEIHVTAMRILHDIADGHDDCGSPRMASLEQRYGPGAVAAVWMHWGRVIAQDRTHLRIPAGSSPVPPGEPTDSYEMATRVVDACRAERPDAKLIGDLFADAVAGGKVGDVSAILAIVATIILYRK
jgi:hypothetical protein